MMCCMAVFKWDNGYCETVKYPKNVKKALGSNRTKPTELKILLRNAEYYDSKIVEWFSSCYSILNKRR